MAMTKTIQATVKNRTDTAANWTQKNPVLAEGEIIVVQTSAGETRLKIGDGVKTFTQLPYTDEQIYNNVVTSVNGQTGDITLSNDSKSLGLASAAVGQIPKIKAVDSNGIPTEWEPATLSSDMFYVLDVVDNEEDNTVTINNNFDDVVAANYQGKIFVFGGICLSVSHTGSESDGTITEIEFTEIGKGYVVSLTWNRGNSTATITYQIFPTFGLEAILSTPGIVCYDGEDFAVKSKADLSGAYIVEVDSNDILVNDYTEFENAVKSGATIIIKISDTSYTVCTHYGYDDSSIICYLIFESEMFTAKFDKSTKRLTITSLAELNNTYFVNIDENDNIINDYDGLDNAIKANKLIVVKMWDKILPCQYANRNESEITFAVQIISLFVRFSVDKNTKELTIHQYYFPMLDSTTLYQSSSGNVYYDKAAGEFIIKDTTPPTATASTAGTIKVGNGLSISADGTLSVTTATYYTGTADPVNTLGADGDLYLKTEG